MRSVEYICKACGSCGVVDVSVSVDELHNHRRHIDKERPVDLIVRDSPNGMVMRYLKRKARGGEARGE